MVIVGDTKLYFVQMIFQEILLYIYIYICPTELICIYLFLYCLIHGLFIICVAFVYVIILCIIAVAFVLLVIHILELS